MVTEYTDRLPYFESLRHLLDADLLFVPGSNDAAYTASKIYPYILAEKPILAIFRDTSSVVEVLERTRAGKTIVFGGDGVSDDLVSEARQVIELFLSGPLDSPNTNWKAFSRYTARDMAGEISRFFGHVVEASSIRTTCK